MTIKERRRRFRVARSSPRRELPLACPRDHYLAVVALAGVGIIRARAVFPIRTWRVGLAQCGSRCQWLVVHSCVHLAVQKSVPRF